MPLPNVTTTSTARVQPTVTIYTGWALKRAIDLDCACAGVLASSFYFGSARRQAMFLVLACFDTLGQSAIANRLRRANETLAAPGPSDAELIGRAILLLRRPRDLVRAVFGSVPDGLIGTMQRLGHDPAGQPKTYHELFRLFSSRDPADLRKVRVIGQMSGSLMGAQIEIASLLDPVLLHPLLLSKIYEVKHASELNLALAYVRQRCSGASDEAIRASLSRLKPDDHRHTAFQSWAKRFDRPARTLDTRGDPTLVVLDTAEALIDAGRRYANCLSTKVNEAFLGIQVYVEYRPDRQGEPGAIAELRTTSQGYLLEGLHARENCRVRSDRARLIRQRLSACGVALYDRAPGDNAMLEAIENVIGVCRLGAPDNNNWGEEAIEVAGGNTPAEAA